MGQKLGAPPLLEEWDLGPHLRVALAETYLHAKWHLDPSSRLATTDMGQTLWGSAPFSGRGDGSPSDTMWPGRGLPAWQVSS